MTNRARVLCPNCKQAAAATDFDKLTIRTLNRVFGGSDEESRIHFCHPDDAGTWNKMLGVNNYQSDGSVKFADRKDEEKFRKALNDWKTKGLAREREQKAEHAEQVERGKIRQVSTDSTLALREREDTPERRTRVGNIRKNVKSKAAG